MLKQCAIHHPDCFSSQQHHTMLGVVQVCLSEGHHGHSLSTLPPCALTPREPESAQGGSLRRWRPFGAAGCRRRAHSVQVASLWWRCCLLILFPFCFLFFSGPVACRQKIKHARKQASKHGSRQASKRASRPESKHARKQASEPASKQASTEAGKQASKRASQKASRQARKEGRV